ncbi:MAG TPA: aquaporin [Gaiellaceae bacterium]|jgi:aquaporin Z
MNEDMLRRGVAEFIGTFTLIFIGGGAGIAVAHYHPSTSADLVGVALANGLAIGIMVTNLGHISGGHFNPAITLGFLSTKRIAASLAGLYWACQLLGGTVAALILRELTSRAAVAHHAAPIPAAHLTDAKAVIFELILTFFLVWAVWATAVDPRGAFKAIAGLAIGLTITIDVLMGGPFTGAAMNPARAFGPELAGKVWTGWWVYWIGPMLGALLAAQVYEYLYLRPTAPPVVGTPESQVDEPRPGETALS